MTPVGRTTHKNKHIQITVISPLSRSDWFESLVKVSGEGNEHKHLVH